MITDPNPERIQGETNTEIRRCAIERFGWAGFAAAAKWNIVDESEWGTLWDVPPGTVTDDEDVEIRVVTVLNGTPAKDGSELRYGLGVPKDCATALQACAWTYDMPEAAYKQIARRT